MNGKGPQHIDELFKEGLDPKNDPVLFDEAHWSNLEKRLAAYEKRKGLLVWLWPLAGIAALLLLAFSIWSLWPSSRPTTPEPIVQQEFQQPEKPATAEKPAVTDSLQDRDTSVKKRTTDQPPRRNQQTFVAAAPDEDLSTQVKPGETIAGERPQKAGSPEEKDLAPSQEPEEPIVVDETQQESEKDRMPETEELAVPPTTADELALAENTPNNREVAISLMVAPAYNGVDNLSNGSVGGDIGLLLTVGLTQRWSVSTGAVYAKKLYDTDIESYDYGSYGSSEMVRADCRVLDIPLNINYAILQKGNTSISLGSGISSYIMLKEDYYFQNGGSYGENTEDVHLVNENQHWFSVLNLQANVQQQLSSKLSVSLQPYLKLPFNDIGYAHVRLQSFGMALSANWNL